MKKCFLIISLCIAVFQLNANPERENPTRIKKQSFSNIKEVRFEQSYGNINVIESDSKKIELEIQYFDDDEDKPVCEIATTGDILSVKTILTKNSGEGVSIFGLKINHSNTINTRIDYIIAVPRDVDMTVNLKYGSIRLDDFYGKFTCDLAYSDLNAKDFKMPPVITCKYGNITIGDVDVLELSSFKYSNLRINDVNTLKIQGSYSNYSIGSVKTLDADFSYGTLKTSSAATINADLSYSTFNADDLEKSLIMDCSYTNVKIDNSSKYLENIAFNGRYSDFKLTLDPDLSAEFDIRLKYGGLSIQNHKVTASVTEEGDNKIFKQGKIGDKTPTAKIVISDSYAKVTIR
jgi:hypothetical protein